MIKMKAVQPYPLYVAWVAKADGGDVGLWGRVVGWTESGDPILAVMDMGPLEVLVGVRWGLYGSEHDAEVGAEARKRLLMAEARQQKPGEWR